MPRRPHINERISARFSHVYNTSVWFCNLIHEITRPKPHFTRVRGSEDQSEVGSAYLTRARHPRLDEEIMDVM